MQFSSLEQTSAEEVGNLYINLADLAILTASLGVLGLRNYIAPLFGGKDYHSEFDFSPTVRQVLWIPIYARISQPCYNLPSEAKLLLVLGPTFYNMWDSGIFEFTSRHRNIGVMLASWTLGLGMIFLVYQVYYRDASIFSWRFADDFFRIILGWDIINN